MLDISVKENESVNIRKLLVVMILPLDLAIRCVLFLITRDYKCRISN